MSNDVPCKDCKHRVLGCHSTCSAYKDFQLRRKAINTQRKHYLENKDFLVRSSLRSKRH